MGNASKLRPKLKLLRRYGVKVERHDRVEVDYNTEAENLCALMIDSCPSGTVEAFARITGADVNKVFDIGNQVFVKNNKRK
jgi:hypothetical protein